ncbi:MAG: GNAT family N-acetyltransferase [Nitriliruptoraceae bacterium]
MRIRTLLDGDLPAAHALWAVTDHLGPIPAAEVAQLRAFEPELVLGAHDDDGLVGVVLGSFDGRRGWINRLAVAERARRRGVARALVAELEHRLRERGCVQVNLLVLDDNVAGRAFWSAAGYGDGWSLRMHAKRLDGTVRSGPPWVADLGEPAEADPTGGCGPADPATPAC